jgi:hypothetical protein
VVETVTLWKCGVVIDGEAEVVIVA